MRKVAGGMLGTLTAVLLIAAPVQARVDYSGPAYNILAPGEFGGLPANQYSTDQGKLYDALTPLQGHVTAADLEQVLPVGEVRGHRSGRAHASRPAARDCRSCATATTSRTSTARTRDDVMFGSGWVAAEDRGLLLLEGLGPAYWPRSTSRASTPFGLVTSARSFTPSAQTIRFVAKQENVLRRAGSQGPPGAARPPGLDRRHQRLRGLARAGRARSCRTAKLTDAIAGFAFIGSIFGNGGGNEVANSDFLARLAAQARARRRG